VVEHRRITVLAPGEQMVCHAEDSWEGTRVCQGNSYATPVTAGVLALVAQKYPDATSNQLLHSLLENADRGGRGSGHDATFGYGVVDLRAMLAVDPTGYPDVNPLLSEGTGRYDVTAQDVDRARLLEGSFITTLQGSTPSPSPTYTSEPRPVGVSLSGLVWVGAGLVVLVLLAAVVVVVVVLARRRPGGP